MTYVHEQNILKKIKDNYNGLEKKIKKFYDEKYLVMKNNISKLIFDEDHTANFQIAAEIFSKYYQELSDFATNHKIKSQSKFVSSFLEEISVYLFKDIPDIVCNSLGIYNGKIYAGLKLDQNHHVKIINKRVDFCIGKKVSIKIDNQPSISLILPLISVEVKTYLDATMLGEIKSSSRAIKSASPSSKSYVLIGYKDLDNVHLIAARHDSVIDEIFVLRANDHSPLDHETIYNYWKEITTTLQELANEQQFITPGRLLNP